jgi:penicillin-binding protein 2
MKQKTGLSRIIIISIIFLGMFIWLVYVLFQLQIVNGSQYTSNSDLKIQKKITIKSTRGNIYDRNGNLLAGNQIAYSLTLEDKVECKTNRERQLTLNGIATKIVKLLEKNNDKLNNDLKIKIGENGNFEFTVEGIQLKRFKADIFGKAKIEDMTDEEKAATAEEIIQYLSNDIRFALFSTNEKEYTIEEKAKYGLENEYNKDELLSLIGIRYMLYLNAYQKYLPIILAENVSEQTVVNVLENSSVLEGVNIITDSSRVYYGGEAFSHILGYTGKISADELEVLKEENFNYDDHSIVGKGGVEEYLETTLHGSDGLLEVYVNKAGRKLEEISKLDPVSGRDVYLSIDKELQIATYNILEQQIAGILIDNIINSKEFDKTAIMDASDIKIPVYDVYYALIDNNIIDIKRMETQHYTRTVQRVYDKFKVEKDKFLIEMKEELLQKGTLYTNLSDQLQEYENYIVNNILNEGLELFNSSAIDKNDKQYKDWTESKTICLKDYLYYCIEKGWIDINNIDSDVEYVDMQEAYELVVDSILLKLETDTTFDKSIYQYLIKNDIITGKEICELLYEQGVLTKLDEDYELLKKNSINSYDFIIRKIEKLEITPGQLALDPCSGSAVIIDPGTGKLLACVTYPGYDNNRLANQMDSVYFNQLRNDLSSPFYNRATQQLTAPGSTFKPVTIIAGLQENVITPLTSIHCDGVFNLVETPLKCWKRSGHGVIKDAASAIQNSCNDYLCDISFRLGKLGGYNYNEDKALKYLQQYARLFDLDKKTGIEIIESEPHMTDRYAIPSAIGQGTHNYTTVQLARYVNTLATRGNSYQLSLIQYILDDSTKEVESIDTKLQNSVQLSSEIWNTIDKGMEQFANSNSLLQDMDITIAGKTGTAQESKSRPDHALFIGYAPANNPEISIAVRIANGYSSGNAVGIGKDIINYFFGFEDKETIITGRASKVNVTNTD